MTTYDQLANLGKQSKQYMERLVQSRTYPKFTANMSEHDLYIAARTILTLELNQQQLKEAS